MEYKVADELGNINKTLSEEYLEELTGAVQNLDLSLGQIVTAIKNVTDAITKSMPRG